jgi:hypothetical protein
VPGFDGQDRGQGPHRRRLGPLCTAADEPYAVRGVGLAVAGAAVAPPWAAAAEAVVDGSPGVAGGRQLVRPRRSRLTAGRRTAGQQVDGAEVRS